MRSLSIAVAAALAATAISFASHSTWAFDASYHRQPKDIPPKLQASLTETISDEAGPFLDKEDEKKNAGQTYTDLQPKFEYLPNYGPGGQLVVSVKLGGAEYTPIKDQSGKGKATGRLKYLVFTYALQKNNKWVEVTKPRWETQDLGAAAGKKMTAAAERAEKRKAAIAARQEALKAAAEKAQQSANQPSDASSQH